MKYPGQNENYDVDVFNGNFRELDLKREQLGRDLQAESARAQAAEATNAEAIAAEVSRAKSAEKANSDAISAETDRAMAQEGIIDSKFTAEAAAIRALIDMAYASANGYTDEKIAALVDGAPGALDTLKEIADALEQNEDVVDALNDAIGTKANKNEFESHVADTDIHVTAAEKSAWNNPQFTKAPTRGDLNSGDSTPTLWGKVKKWFSDLKAVAFSGSYNDLSNKPILGNALIRITQGGVEKGSFTTNQAGDDVVIALEEGGAGVDPEDITPESIGAVAKSGDTMSGSLTVNIPQPSGDIIARKGLRVKKDGTDRGLYITASEIEVFNDSGFVGDLILNPDGNSNHGSVTVVSPLRVEGGMFVNNGIPQGYGDSSYFMCFNAYTSDATGGKVSYRNRKDVGFADQWHWQTTANNLNKFCKIYLKHGNYGFHPSSMFSFNLEIYQSYVYWKISISGYRLIDTDGVRWYSPRATLIDTTDTTDSSFYIIFGKDADDKLWIAFPSMMYTGVSICNINTGYIDPAPLFDTNSAFDIAIESSLTGTIQFDQYIWGPVKRNEFNELKNSVSNGKAQVASAITALGITTAADASFATMVNNINGLFQQDTYTASLCGIWWMNSSTTYNMGRMVIQNAKQCKYAKIRLDICYSSSSNARLDAWGSKTNWELNNSTITFNVANGTGTSGRSGSLAISDSAGSLVPYGVSELKTFAGHAHINVPLINVGGSYVTINVTLSSTKTSFEIATVAVFAHAMFSN